jgi:site-specific recombinase XerD
VEQPIGERTVNQIIDQAAKLAGLEHLKVHSLRHTAAKLRRKGGYTLEQVSEFLDHNSIATTQIYLGALESKGDVGWRNVEALIGLDG